MVSEEKTIIMFTHSDYKKIDAGVEKVVRGQEKIFMEKGYNVVIFYPNYREVWFGKKMFRTLVLNYQCIKNSEYVKLFTMKEIELALENQNYEAIIIHELITYKNSYRLIKMFEKVSRPIYQYNHDYFMICYNHTLRKNNKKFCGGEPISITKCKGCKYFFKAIKTKLFYSKYVKQCNKIKYIFPSEVVREIWKNNFTVDSDRMIIIPNTMFGSQESEYPKDPDQEKLRIAYVGYDHTEKGWEVWKEICNKFNIYYELYIMGNGQVDNSIKNIFVSTSKDGENAMIDSLRKHKIDIAFLWSTCPETYSYTFYESYIAGCMVITGKYSGNIASMVCRIGCGKVFEEKEDLYEYLEEVPFVKKDINRIRKKLVKHPTLLFTNDMIVKLVEGKVYWEHPDIWGLSDTGGTI